MPVPGPPSFLAEGMMALPPPTAARSGAPSFGCSSAAACSYSPASPTMAALPNDSAGAPSASVAFLASSAPSSSPASISGVRSSTKRPANGFSSTATAAALRTGRLASRPPSLRISSTTVTILRSFTMVAVSPSRLEAVEDQPVEQLGIEVRRFLRQHRAAADDRLQLLRRRRGDEEGGLVAPLACPAHGLVLVGGVVHVRARVELGVVDVEQRAQQSLVEHRDGERAPRGRGARRPPDRPRRLRAHSEHGGLGARHHGQPRRRRG